METSTERHFRFADFELDETRRLLLKEGRVVALNPKTFDVLLALVERRGQVVSRDELLDKVWSGQFVEEENLTVQVSTLRKLFGERAGDHRFVVTVPGKGYSFVAELNDGANAEIVVESHSSSHIIVEEKIEEKGGVRKNSPRSRALILSLGVLVGILILGGGAAWIYSAFVQNNRQAVLAAKGAERQALSRVFTSSGSGRPERVAISPDGKTLVYVERLKSKTSLRFGEIENNNSVQIVPFSDREYRYLAFSPDGKNVYFTARSPDRPQSTLMRVSIFGGAVQELISEVDSSITFSPDSRSLAFFRTDRDANTTSLMTADAETGQNERVLAVLERADTPGGGGISWSPDGKVIVFGAVNAETGGSRLVSASAADGRLDQIGNAVGNSIVNIVWLTDGGGLIVSRNSSNDAGDGKIWFVSYPQGETRQITNDTANYMGSSLSVSSDDKIAAVQARTDPQIRAAPGGDVMKSRNILQGVRSRSEGLHGLAVAPDGKILFTAKANGMRTIWEMDPNGANQRQLTASQKDVEDRQVSVTSDDRYLVFDSNRSGSSEIWRANRDGSNPKMLTSGGSNVNSTVSPDGSWVIYASRNGSRYELRRVSIDGGEPIQMNAQGAWPAISPDGRFIAYAQGRSDGGSGQNISVIPFEGGAAVKAFEIPFSAIVYNRFRWTPDGKAIVYKDSIQGLWRQDLNREKPEPINFPDDLRIYHFAYASDGELVFAGGIPNREIVILENLR